MNLGFKDKVIVISGSSRGIGKGIAGVLLEEGARVVITGRGEEDVRKTFDEFAQRYPEGVLSFVGDLTEDISLDGLETSVLSRWGVIDGVVANAGAVKHVHSWDISHADWDWYLRNNFDVAVRFIQKFIPHLIRSKGSIVAVGSIAGVEDIGAPLPYSSAKAALAMFSKGLARTLAPDGVRVNSIAPGNVLFPGGNWDKKMKDDPERIQTLIHSTVPMKRFASPEEIGCACAFLLSEKSSFTTGSCLVVDGGQTALFI